MDPFGKGDQMNKLGMRGSNRRERGNRGEGREMRI